MSFFDEYNRIANGRPMPGLTEGRTMKGDWALVQTSSGMKDTVLSVHKTKEAAENAMRKRGGEPNSQFTKSMVIYDVNPKTGTYELLNLDGKYFVRPNLDNWKKKQAAPQAPQAKTEGSLGDNMEIAKTIGKQMGGKLQSMLGARLMAVENGLEIKWPNKKRSLGNVCVVTLRPDDTYDMEFFNGMKSVKKFEGLHAEDLIPTFEGHTGWYLHL